MIEIFARVFSIQSLAAVFILAKYSTLYLILDWIRQIDDPSLVSTKMIFNSDGTRLAAITEQSCSYLTRLLRRLPKSDKIRPVIGYKLELKSIEITNNVLENENPPAFLCLVAGNSTRNEYFGIITALKMELGGLSLIEIWKRQTKPLYNLTEH